MNDRQTIEDFAWQCTIGLGVDPEEADEPSYDALEALSSLLKRKLTAKDMDTFLDAWQKNLQAMQQP